MQALYLALLLISIGGLAVIDWRYKLAFWNERKRTVLVVATGVGIFILWDILGIALGIFGHGAGRFNLPFVIAPEFPIEELFFLTLLCYNAVILYRGIGLWRSRI